MQHAQASKATGAKAFYNRLSSVNGATAAVVWILGTWLSARAGAQAAGINLSNLETPPLVFVVGSIMVQWILTRAQSPFWRWKMINAKGKVPAHVASLAFFSMLIDALINAGGVWPLLRGLGNTDLWKMTAEIAGTTGEPTMLIRAFVAMIVGVMVAGFSEYFWNLED